MTNENERTAELITDAPSTYSVSMAEQDERTGESWPISGDATTIIHALLAEADAAIAAGWTPDPHPATCCPTLPPEPPKEARTAQQRREWCNVRAYKSDERAIRLRRVEARLTAELTPGRRPDSAEINIPFHKRAKSLDADITKAQQLAIATRGAAHHESRAKYWRNRAQEQTS